MADAPVLLDATLRPNPPLAVRTLMLVLGWVSIFNLAFAAYFVALGAWPVMPFMGLDIALLGWAFFASRKAAQRLEHVVLTPATLQIARHIPDKPVEEVALNPYWARIEAPEYGPIRVRAEGRCVTLGAFLAPPDKLSFAQALRDALRKAKEFHGF